MVCSDFETSLIEAVQLQFPNAKHLGCHFHFGQALWRKIQDVGLTVKYREVDDIRSFVQHCNALAFIPTAEVCVKFIEAVDNLSNENRSALADFIEYFRTMWIDGLFPIHMWNKYGCDLRHRTNNAMEEWHSSLRRLLPTHPNIFVFINICHLHTTSLDLKKALDSNFPKFKGNEADNPPIPTYNRILDTELSKFFYMTSSRIKEWDDALQFQTAKFQKTDVRSPVSYTANKPERSSSSGVSSLSPKQQHSLQASPISSSQAMTDREPNPYPLNTDLVQTNVVGSSPAASTSPGGPTVQQVEVVHPSCCTPMRNHCSIV